MSKAIEQSNLEIFKEYDVGQKVRLFSNRDIDTGEFTSVELGTIVGFMYNSVGELILAITPIDGNMRLINPRNKTFLVEKV